MNKDYTYCFGYNIFALADVCKNCRRLIHDNQIPNNAIWWTDAKYDTNTGKCLLYEPKCMFDRCESFNQDLSKWNISKVEHNTLMFCNCPIKEEYKPKFK